MQNPVTLRSLVENGLDQYTGVFVPGGHPPMVDLMQDPLSGQNPPTAHEFASVFVEALDQIYERAAI